MKKSNQFSNKLIARKDLINSISAISALLIVAFGIIMFLLVLIPQQDINGKLIFEIEERLLLSTGGCYLFCSEIKAVPLLCVVGGLALGISQFEFLHRKKYCSTLSSFGIKRNRVFLNRLFIGLIPGIICIFIPYIIALKFNIEAFAFHTDMLLWFFLEISQFVSTFVLSYTVAIFSCMFTGRTIEAMAGAISLVILPATILSLAETIWDLSLFGYPGAFYSQAADIIAKIDPTYFSSLLYAREFVNTYPINSTFEKENVFQIVISLAWILISFVTLALIKSYFTKKFQPENSGFKGINKYMSTLVSFSMPLFVSAWFIEYFSGYFWPIISDNIAFLVIGIGTVIGIVASIICGLIIHFTHKNLKTALFGSLALVGTISIVLILGVTSIFGTYHNIPNAEEIAKIEIKTPFQEFFPDVRDIYADFTQQYLYDTSSALVISDKDDIETILELHKKVSVDKENATTASLYFTYTFKDGFHVTRKYKYPGEEATKELLMLWDTKAAKEMFKAFLFPESPNVEMLDKAPRPTTFSYEHPYIMDYNDNDAYILITTRDREIKSVLDEITESEFIKLKKAIYKDICNLNSSEWFTPKETQIGALTFRLSSYQGIYDNSTGFNIYINPSMTNTIKALKSLNLYKHFECKKEIEKVLVADVKEYISWENSALATNKKDVAVHQPYFTYTGNGWSEICFNCYENGEYLPPVKEITDKIQIKSLIKKGYIAYNIFNDGKIVFVKYSDGTTSSYVIPYGK